MASRSFDFEPQLKQRFQSLEPIGHGASGALFRARRAGDEHAYALKVPIDGSRSSCAALRREIAGLKRLSHLGHAGIVKLVEADDDELQPWYAMEFITGEPLRRYQQRIWAPYATRAVLPLPNPLTPLTASAQVTADAAPSCSFGDTARPTERSAEVGACLPVAGAGHLRSVLKIVQEIAEALAAMHREGVVHGDLNPNNIMLRASDSTPVIVDFGTAFRTADVGLAREVDAPSIPYRGTPGFLAPEQIRGDAIDPRCDLYALGCILYELVTGRPPITESSIQALLKQHVHTPPDAPALYARQVPAALDALILRLLRKDPSERVARASQVAELLGELLRESAPMPAGSPTGPSRVTTLLRPTLCGRDPELSLLAERARETRAAGTGGLILVLGEEGIGRTRFLNEGALRLAQLGVRVIIADARSATDGSVVPASFGPFAAAIRWAIETSPALDPGCLEDLTAIGAGRPLRELHQSQARLFFALRQALGAYAAATPTAFIVDDIDDTDELTQAFLQQYAQSLSQIPLLLLAACSPAGGRELASRLRASACDVLDLGRLELGAIRKMTRQMLGAREVSEDLVDLVFRACEGIPLQAVEYLRFVISRAEVRVDARESASCPLSVADAIHVPDSLAKIFTTRLASLGPEAQRVLEFAAVLGRQFSREDLRASEHSFEQLDQALERLLVHQVLQCVGADEYRFMHAQWHATVLLSLTPAQREASHRVAAVMLESRAAGAEPSRLGLHWAHAGEAGRALPHLLAGARSAIGRRAPSEAIELLETALAQCRRLAVSETQIREGELYENLGDLLVGAAKHARARMAYDAALSRVGGWLDVARIHRKIAASHVTLHEHEAATEHLQAAQLQFDSDLPRDAAAHREWIGLQLVRFDHLYFSRQTGLETTRLLAELEPLVEPFGTVDQRCAYTVCYAGNQLACGRYRFATGVVDRVRTRLQRDEPLLSLEQTALLQLTLGFATMIGPTREHLVSAHCTLQLAERDAERSRDPTLLARTRVYIAITAVRLGDIELAKASARRAFEAAEAAQIAPYTAAARAVEGWVAWRLGDLPRATKLLVDARAVWAQHPNAFPFQWIGGFPLLALLLNTERFEEAAAVVSGLLQADQQKLPDELAAAMCAASEVPADNDAAIATRYLETVLRLAQQLAMC